MRYLTGRRPLIRLCCLAAACGCPFLSFSDAAFAQVTPGVASSTPTGAAPLTLSQAIAAALATNPNARAAAQQLAQAQARQTQAQARTRYSLSLNSTVSGSHARVYQSPPSQETFGTLQNTLIIPLPLGPGPRLAVRQANEQLSAAQSQYDAARLALAGQVSVAYYDLLRRQALLAVAQETQAQAARQLSDTRKRNLAGDVAQLDVLQAQVPVAAAQAQTFGAQNDAAVARQTLNDLIGRPLDVPTGVADVPAAAPAIPYTLEQARTSVLAHSPDVRAADATVRANEAALQAARLFRRPTVELQAIDIRSKDVTSFSSEDTLQAAITLPLSDGGLGRAQVREADAALAAARAQAEATRRAALASVSSAYLTAQSGRQQVDAARVARDIAQVTYDKTVRGYRVGLFPFTQVLNAQTALTQARIAFTQALYNAAVAVSTLGSAVNGGATTGPGAPPAGAPGAVPPGNGGTSPAGATTPGTTPAGNSTTGNAPGGAGGAGGRGAP